ncbi:MAG: type II toxin-antitoxin system HicA family toxin [Elusimicrobiota bacterium]
MKPPLVSGAKAIKALKRAGWRVVGQRGSHVKLHRESDENTLIVPLHDELSRWTLKGILTDGGLSVEEFIRLL